MSLGDGVMRPDENVIEELTEPPQLLGVPDTLGPESGLDFVELMGGQDPLVTLQVRAARLTRTGTLV
ncbi:hypothetical protein ACIO8H_25530 [Streptomyces sp. NPDC087226]|uniref:hypothetical protein n=1 Tax=Streptomyces sp. NPDC087226 TaxID=3365771 RepID=UPI0038015545